MKKKNTEVKSKAAQRKDATTVQGHGQRRRQSPLVVLSTSALVLFRFDFLLWGRGCVEDTVCIAQASHEVEISLLLPPKC